MQAHSNCLWLEPTYLQLFNFFLSITLSKFEPYLAQKHCSVEINLVLMEKLFFYLHRVFNIEYYLPLEKGMFLHLNTFGSHSPPKMPFAKFGWNLSSCYERNRNVSYYRFLYYLLLLKAWFSFVQTWMHFTLWYFVRNVVEIGKVVLEN